MKKKNTIVGPPSMKAEWIYFLFMMMIGYYTVLHAAISLSDRAPGFWMHFSIIVIWVPLFIGSVIDILRAHKEWKKWQ